MKNTKVKWIGSVVGYNDHGYFILKCLVCGSLIDVEAETYYRHSRTQKHVSSMNYRWYKRQWRRFQMFVLNH